MLVAVILVLIGSATHATWNLLAGRVAGEDSKLFVWIYSTFSLLLLAPTSAIVLMWGGSGAELSWTLVGASLVSGAFHMTYALLLQAAYARADVNITYPVARGLGPVLVALVAVGFLGERLAWPGWWGIALITAGVAVVSTGVIQVDPTSDETARHERRVAGVRWGLLVAAAIASYTLWDAYVVTDLEIDPVLYYSGTGIWMFALLTAISLHNLPNARRLVRKHWRVAAVIGVLTPVSYVLVLIALTMAPVSVVAPLRSTSIVLGSLGVWLWLGETDGRRRLIGALIVTLGVGALVWG